MVDEPSTKHETLTRTHTHTHTHTHARARTHTESCMDHRAAEEEKNFDRPMRPSRPNYTRKPTAKSLTKAKIVLHTLIKRKQQQQNKPTQQQQRDNKTKRNNNNNKTIEHRGTGKTASVTTATFEAKKLKRQVPGPISLQLFHLFKRIYICKPLIGASFVFFFFLSIFFF